jgi:hypothetical protein
MLLVVANNFHVRWAPCTINPFEANPPLIVNADAVLPLPVTFSAERLENQIYFLTPESCPDGAEAFVPARTIRCRYATHFIASFLRFLAQSSRYKSISFW